MTNALDTASNTELKNLDLGVAADREQSPETTPAHGSLLRISSLPLTWAKTGRQAAAPQRAQTRRVRTYRARVDWYALGVVLLLLASAALCVYRLCWAMQP